MKNTLIILCILISTSVFPQQSEYKERMSKHSNLSLEEMATLKSKKIALQLDLNKSQQAQVEKLFIIEMNERKAIKENLRETRSQVKDTSKANHFKMINAKLDRQIVLQDKMKRILDVDQYKRWRNSSRKGMSQKRHNRIGDRKKMHMGSTRTHMHKEINKN